MIVKQKGKEGIQYNAENMHNNFLASLKVSPRDVEVDAIINYSRLLSFAFVLSAMLITAVVKYVPSGLNSENTSFIQMLIFLVMMSLTIMPMIMSVVTLDPVTNMLSYFLNLKVKYHDGVLDYANIKRKFYSEIWDIKYKKHFIGKGATLTIYAMNEEKKIPYKDIIRFKDDAKAKYMYDSFWNHERIKKFENIDK